MRYYLPGKEKYWYVLTISFALSSIWLALVRFFLWLLYNKDLGYMHSLAQSSNIRFAVGFLLTGCVTMLSLLWYTQQEQKALTGMKQEAESLLREAELFKLRQQLQPHFLFNSLNSISALAGSQPEKARHMIQQLSDFLRGTLKKEEKQMVELHEEIQFLELYLDIEKVRFGNRLLTHLRISEEAVSQMIPALILQPVVENAIKFGLYDTMDEVTITIHAFVSSKNLQIEVSNPFDPYTAISAKGTGFGLASIQRRLLLLYKRNDLLQTNITGSIFTTTLIIPL
jgi:LytS/YehU family sensor histidine kinase